MAEEEKQRREAAAAALGPEEFAHNIPRAKALLAHIRGTGWDPTTTKSKVIAESLARADSSFLHRADTSFQLGAWMSNWTSDGKIPWMTRQTVQKFLEAFHQKVIASIVLLIIRHPHIFLVLASPLSLSL